MIFASAFPGLDDLATDLEHYYTDRGHREQLLALEAVRSRMGGNEPAVPEIDRRIADLRHRIGTSGFAFDRRFLFRCLSMGHSQFAEIIGARGPNTQINAACASTTQALCGGRGLRIRAGRAPPRGRGRRRRRHQRNQLLPWIGRRLPGLRRRGHGRTSASRRGHRRSTGGRHGMIVGMGAAAIVVESAEAARERGHGSRSARCSAAVTANSAFHGTRLDVAHVATGHGAGRCARPRARGVDRHRRWPRATASSSRTRRTPRRAGAAPPRRSTPCGRSSARAADSDRDRQHEGLHRPRHGRRHRGRRGRQGAGDRRSCRRCPTTGSPDPDLGDLNLSTGRRRTRCGFAVAPGRQPLRLADQRWRLLRRVPGAGRRRGAAPERARATRTGSPTRLAWQRWLGAGERPPRGPAVELVEHRRLRVVDDGPGQRHGPRRRRPSTLQAPVPAVPPPVNGARSRPSRATAVPPSLRHDETPAAEPVAPAPAMPAEPVDGRRPGRWS